MKKNISIFNEAKENDIQEMHDYDNKDYSIDFLHDLFNSSNDDPNSNLNSNTNSIAILRRNIAHEINIENLITNNCFNDVIMNILCEMCEYRNDIYRFIDEEHFMIITKEMLNNNDCCEKLKSKMMATNLFTELCNKDERCIHVVYQIISNLNVYISRNIISFDDIAIMFSLTVKANFNSKVLQYSDYQSNKYKSITIDNIDILFRSYFEMKNVSKEQEENITSTCTEILLYGQNIIGFISLFQCSEVLLYQYQSEPEYKERIEQIIIRVIQTLIQNYSEDGYECSSECNHYYIQSSILICLQNINPTNISQISIECLQNYIKHIIYKTIQNIQTQQKLQTSEEEYQIFQNIQNNQNKYNEILILSLDVVVQNRKLWNEFGNELVCLFLNDVIPMMFCECENENEIYYFTYKSKISIIRILYTFFSEEIDHCYYPLIFELLFQFYNNTFSNNFCIEVLRFSCILLIYEDSCATLFNESTISNLIEMSCRDNEELSTTANFLLDKINDILDEQQ